MRNAFALACLVAALAASKGQASPIVYTETVRGSGTIGTVASPQSFTSALVTITFTGDTANVTGSSPIFFNATGTATVNIAGFGTFTFKNPIRVFVNQTAGPVVGIQDIFNLQSPKDILDTRSNPSLASYDLTTPIGPLTGDGVVSPNALFPTDGGTGFFFALTSVDVKPTFQASTGAPGPPTTAVPEPASLAVFGGIALLGAVGYRRRKAPATA